MTSGTTRRPGVWLAALLLLALPLATHAKEQGSEPAAETMTQVTEEKTQEQIDAKLAERRKAMMEEAHAALDETHEALRALDEGRQQDALDALARATGKLELIVARDPDLALAPVDVQLVTHDLYATPEAVRAARDEAGELLDDGQVQEARRLLADLASEIVIRVSNLPLATYPDAIKAISPLIDEGQIEEAKAGLRAALSTLVVTDRVIPLPVLRAQTMLDEAERLVKQEAPTDEDRERVDELVAGAREQVRMAELLGYGAGDEHEALRKQIAELEKTIRGGEETRGVFAKLRRSLESLQSSFFE